MAGGEQGFVGAIRGVLVALSSMGTDREPSFVEVAACGDDPDSFSRGWGREGTLVAQPFRPSRGGRLRRVEVGVARPASTVGGFLVQVVNAPGGVPSRRADDVLASAVVPEMGIPEDEEAMLGVDFNGPWVDADVSYAVVVSRLGSDRWAFVTVPGDTCGILYLASAIEPDEGFRPSSKPTGLVFEVHVV